MGSEEAGARGIPPAGVFDDDGSPRHSSTTASMCVPVYLRLRDSPRPLRWSFPLPVHVCPAVYISKTAQQRRGDARGPPRSPATAVPSRRRLSELYCTYTCAAAERASHAARKRI